MRKATKFCLAAILLFLSVYVHAGCPTLDSSRINNGTSAAICLPGIVNLSVYSNILPSGGKVEWFYSNTPNFDPRLGQGSFFSLVNLPTIPVVRCPNRCPDLLSIFINACGPSLDEPYNEFVVLKSGEGFLSTDFQLDFAPQNNTLSTPPYSNNDVNIGSNPCGFRTPDASLINSLRVGLCNNTNLFPVTPGDYLPPDALVVFFTSDSVKYNYDLSTLCESGLDLYVMQSSCTRNAGAFTNSRGNDTRTSTFSLLNCNQCTESITYKRNDLAGNEGEFTISGGQILQNVTTPCSAPPYDKFEKLEKISVNVNLTDLNLCDQTIYIRPIITPALSACTGNIGEAVSLTIQCSGLVVNTPNDSICSGEQAIINVPGTGNVSWTVNASSNVQGAAAGSFSGNGSINQVLTLTNSSPGRVIYNITATGGSCGNGTVSDTIDVLTTLSPQITGTLIACGAPSTVLSVSGSFSKYLWSTGATTPTITVTSSDKYWVRVDNGNSCFGYDTVNVVLGNGVKPQITGPTTLCQGDSATLDAGSGFDKYTWTGNLTSQVIVVKSPGTYVVKVSASGCEGADTIVITGINAPTLSSNVVTPSCFGDKNGSIILSTTPVGSYVVNWSDGATGLSRNNIGGGNYPYQLTYSGCILNGSVLVTEPLKILPDLEIIGAGCDGGATGSIEIVSVSNGTTPYTYAINDGVFSGNDFYDGLAPNSYKISIKDARNCRIDTIVNVLQATPLSFNLGADTSITQGDRFTISPQYQGNDASTEYVWTPADNLSCASCPVTEASPLQPTTYILNATNSFGCSFEDSIFIDVTPRRIAYLPNAFTPNGDGLNDFAYIITVIPNTIVKRFEIFNRWGQKVFTASNTPAMLALAGWDGTFNGQRQPVDIYTYYFEVQWEDGKTSEYKGVLTLIR